MSDRYNNIIVLHLYTSLTEWRAYLMYESEELFKEYKLGNRDMSHLLSDSRKKFTELQASLERSRKRYGPLFIKDLERMMGVIRDNLEQYDDLKATMIQYEPNTTDDYLFNKIAHVEYKTLHVTDALYNILQKFMTSFHL